jgi:hypothetical protein
MGYPAQKNTIFHPSGPTETTPKQKYGQKLFTFESTF